MRDLPNIMSEDQYKAYIQQSYYTIRRSHRFWSGIFTDQTIEQTLMRSINAPGGLSHGRDLTESIQASFIHANLAVYLFVILWKNFVMYIPKPQTSIVIYGQQVLLKTVKTPRLFTSGSLNIPRYNIKMLMDLLMSPTALLRIL